VTGAQAQPGAATQEGQPPFSCEDLAHGNSARASQDNLLQKSKSQAEVAQQRCESFGDRRRPKEVRDTFAWPDERGSGFWRRYLEQSRARRWDDEAEWGGRRRPSFRIVTGSSEGNAFEAASGLPLVLEEEALFDERLSGPGKCRNRHGLRRGSGLGDDHDKGRRDRRVSGTVVHPLREDNARKVQVERSAVAKSVA
jgi:hypothetical protein